MFRHIVLFRVHDSVSDSDVEDAVSELRELGDVINATSWTVEFSLDSRKGRVIVEDASFADRSTFQRFRDHPAHVAAAEHMARISDWWVGDYDARDK